MQPRAPSHRRCLWVAAAPISPLARAVGSVIIALAMESHEREGFLFMLGYVVLLMLILAMGVLTHVLISP